MGVVMSELYLGKEIEKCRKAASGGEVGPTRIDMAVLHLKGGVFVGEKFETVTWILTCTDITQLLVASMYTLAGLFAPRERRQVG